MVWDVFKGLEQENLCHVDYNKEGTCPPNQNDVFSNWSKGETNIFQLSTPHWFRGYVSPNQIHLLFGTFGQKMGQKGL